MEADDKAIELKIMDEFETERKLSALERERNLPSGAAQLLVTEESRVNMGEWDFQKDNIAVYRERKQKEELLDLEESKVAGRVLRLRL